jgi:hypothetical protein
MHITRTFKVEEYLCTYFLIKFNTLAGGARGGVVVKATRYKLAGR